MNKLVILPLLLAALWTSCGSKKSSQKKSPSRDNNALPSAPIRNGNPAANIARLEWKALLLSGDYFDPHQNKKVRVWDNARKKFKQQLLDRGLRPENITELSADPSLVAGNITVSSKVNLQNRLEDMQVGNDQGCLIFMTSHGSEKGFYINDRRNGENISPLSFSQMVDASCGIQPTIIIISACYSGVMLTPPNMRTPNHLILTAADADSTSFGCDARYEYTFYDRCLVENFPSASTWVQLSQSIKACVQQEEQSQNVDEFSNPQEFVGDYFQSLDIFKH